MFRRHARRLEFASMVLMTLGMAALCQPWILLLHQYSVAMIIVGLLAFNVFSRLKMPGAVEPVQDGQALH